MSRRERAAGLDARYLGCLEEQHALEEELNDAVGISSGGIPRSTFLDVVSVPPSLRGPPLPTCLLYNSLTPRD